MPDVDRDINNNTTLFLSIWTGIPEVPMFGLKVRKCLVSFAFIGSSLLPAVGQSQLLSTTKDKDAAEQQIENILAQFWVAPGPWGIDAKGNLALRIDDAWSAVSPPPTSSSPGLIEISANRSGEVWGIDGNDVVWRRNNTTNGWAQVSGKMRHVTVGNVSPLGSGDDTPNVWGLNANGDIFRLDVVTSEWRQVQGKLVQISAGDAGSVWGVNASGQIWRWIESTRSWQQVQGGLVQVSTGDPHNVWGVNAGGQIWRLNPDGSSWELISGGLRQISAGAQGVWGVNAAGQAWRWAGDSWVLVDGAMKQVELP